MDFHFIGLLSCTFLMEMRTMPTAIAVGMKAPRFVDLVRDFTK